MLLRRFLLCNLCLFSIALIPALSQAAPAAPVIDLRAATTEQLPTKGVQSTTEAKTVPEMKTAQEVKATPEVKITSNLKATAEIKTNTETNLKKPSFNLSNSCANGSRDHWQKNLVATAFKRATPSQSNAGALYQVDTLFPQLISNQLLNTGSIVQPAFMADSLPQTPQYNQHQIAEINQKIARDQHSQLVLAGEILDMSMAHPNATYNPNLYNRVVNKFLDTIEVKNRFEKRDRLFHFRVQLVDGITGEYIFTKEYRTYGVWALTGEVRFGSEKFWQTDYGKQIDGLMKRASRDLAEVIQCQPLKSTVEARPGQTQIVLQSGANNGLKVGDTLSLYQVVMQPSETAYQQSEKRLMNRNTTVEVREIYPSHAVAMVKGTTYLSGEFLAVTQ